MESKLTDHATRRIRQRGIQREDIHLLLRFATRQISHRRCELLSLGREGACDIAATDVSRQVLDRLQRTALVVAQDDGALVTAIKLNGRRRRRYLRQH